MRPDLIARFMTPDGSFRILVARATESVRTGCSVARSEPGVSEVLGDLLVGGALLQHAQGPAERFQLQLDHEGTAGVMLVDVRFGPLVRGRVEHPRPSERPGSPPGAPAFAEPAVVTVSRFPDASMNTGRTAYRSRAPTQGGRIDAALQQYVLESEQVLTLFSLVTDPAGEGDVRVSGGFIVQALPGWERDQLAVITRCLETQDYRRLVLDGADPVDAALTIFEPLALRHLGSDILAYKCRCSKEAAVRMIGLLSPEERGAIAAGGTETVVCEFCGTSYPVSAPDLIALAN